jgi:hypothetical protein
LVAQFSKPDWNPEIVLTIVKSAEKQLRTCLKACHKVIRPNRFNQANSTGFMRHAGVWDRKKAEEALAK